MAEDGFNIIEKAAAKAWVSVKSIFDNPNRKSCAGGVEIPGTGLSVYMGVSRTPAVEQDYKEAVLIGDFCVVVRMTAPGGEVVLGEPSDRQFFSSGEWGPIIFGVLNHADDDVVHQISYAGGEAIEAIAADHLDSFDELVADVAHSSRDERDWYA